MAANVLILPPVPGMTRYAVRVYSVKERTNLHDRGKFEVLSSLTFNLFSSLIQDGNPELRMTLRRSYRHKFERYNADFFLFIFSFCRLSSKQRYPF